MKNGIVKRPFPFCHYCITSNADFNFFPTRQENKEGGTSV